MITGQANLGRLLEIQVSVRLYSDDRDLPHTSFIECNWQGLYSGEKNESISDEGLKKRHVGQQKKRSKGIVAVDEHKVHVKK
jgi:hypothetical protein